MITEAAEAYTCPLLIWLTVVSWRRVRSRIHWHPGVHEVNKIEEALLVSPLLCCPVDCLNAKMRAIIPEFPVMCQYLADHDRARTYQLSAKDQANAPLTFTPSSHIALSTSDM